MESIFDRATFVLASGFCCVAGVLLALIVSILVVKRKR